MQTVHDRAAVEIQRGCVRGCRFCQAGVIYRPRRERPCDEVLDAARAVLAATGYDELGLLSLNTADHSEIGPMVEALRREFGERLAIALPSLRVDSFSVRLAASAAGPGRRNITFAPEAGSQRLRNVINKPTTDADLMQAAETAFEHGWTNLKLYFMVGLPTETPADVQGIVDLVAAVRQAGRRQHGGRAQVKVSTSIFVPKPHTPFQWAAQMSADDVEARHDLLRHGLRRLGVAFTWNDPQQTLIEAMLSRGDRRLSQVIEGAWRRGARFDAWNELLDVGAWRSALEESGLSADFYARRERDEFEVLPWSHIDSGVSEAFLRGEWRKALAGETTPDCWLDACNVCGLQAHSDACATRLARQRRPPWRIIGRTAVPWLRTALGWDAGQRTLATRSGSAEQRPPRPAEAASIDASMSGHHRGVSLHTGWPQSLRSFGRPANAKTPLMPDRRENRRPLAADSPRVGGGTKMGCLTDAAARRKLKALPGPACRRAGDSSRRPIQLPAAWGKSPLARLS